MQNKNNPPLLTPEEKRRKRLRSFRHISILLLAVAAAIGVIFLLRYLGRTSTISQHMLPCSAHQQVEVFGDGVVYYDGASLHYATSQGVTAWSYPVGADASFSVSEDYIIVWAGTDLYILGANGRPTYNEPLNQHIQFARINSHYAAVVLGEEDQMAPTLLILDIQGQRVDDETSGFDGMMLLDCGFFGSNDEYLWSLSMDMYSPTQTYYLHTFQVNKMNTGVINLGSNMVYSVIHAANTLHVFETQYMKTYDYRCVQSTSGTKLVYGWRVMDHSLSGRGVPQMLLAPTKQTDSIHSMTELRMLAGDVDRRFNLPSACVGAAITSDRLYAFSADYLYSSPLSVQAFHAYDTLLPDGRTVSSLIGLTRDGYAIVTSGSEVFSISLPR